MYSLARVRVITAPMRGMDEPSLAYLHLTLILLGVISQVVLSTQLSSLSSCASLISSPLIISSFNSPSSVSSEAIYDDSTSCEGQLTEEQVECE